ncbi:hypothetical protein [Pseudomonas lurida]|uniref:hypothetical protein n=1 Tax=Pseudomonas lurida TaxID=244566 RepID=UPI00273628AF|nr:hypothetical protein [Pseudomonas lurida]WLG27163.1 hypothetical protein PSH68_20475 [Pseudomonas lurida]
MDAKQALQLVRNEVVKARDDQSVTSIHPDNILNLIDAVQRLAEDQEPLEAHNREFHRLNAEQQHSNYQELFRSTIAAGQSAMKAALLVSGGSAAALLAFAGSAWSALKPEGIAFLATALGLLSLALLSSAVSVGFNYLTQSAYSDGWGEPDNCSADRRGDWFNRISSGLIILAYLLCLAGYLSAYFMVGEFKVVPLIPIK